MKILFNKKMLEELKKSADDRNSKYGNSKHTEMIAVHGKNGTFYRRQEVGRKKVATKGREKAKVEDVKKRPSKGSSGSSGEHSYVHTRGDYVCFMKDGQRLTGEIMDLRKDSCTIKGTGKAKGAMYEIPHSDIKQVTKMINPNDAIRYLMDKENIKPGWRGTDGMQPESCDTIEGLLKTVGAVRDEFSGITDSIKADFEALNPIIMKRSSLKRVERIKEKLREDEENYRLDCIEKKKEYKPQNYDKTTDTYHCRTIRDCDGHTICLNSITDVSNVLKYLDKKPYAARIKNNFAKPTAPDSVGYSDINANIKLSNGVIVELQINTTANMVAKERYGHSLYEVWRSIRGNPKYKKLADTMANAQKALYGLSNKYSREGNYPTNEIPKKDGAENIFDENYKHEPYAAVIRESVKDALPMFQQAKKDGAFNADTIKHFEHLVEYIK